MKMWLGLLQAKELPIIYNLSSFCGAGTVMRCTWRRAAQLRRDGIAQPPPATASARGSMSVS